MGSNTYAYSAFTSLGGNEISTSILFSEWGDSSITNWLLWIDNDEEDSEIRFHYIGSLDAGEQTTLDNIVANHTGLASGAATPEEYTHVVINGDGSEDGMICIARGGSASACLKWNETTDQWEAGLAGSEQPIALGSGGGGQTYTFFADQVEYPRSGSDWNITNGAPASKDTNNSSMTVRRFDDGTEEAIGWFVRVPANATNMTVRTKTRAELGANSTVAFSLHRRTIPDNGVIGGWNTATLTIVNVTSDERWQVDESTNTLSNWNMTAGEVHQMQLSRATWHASDNLSGDAALLMVEVEFS